MTAQEIVFTLLGVVAVGSAIMVVTTRQLVHAALWLVVSFGALAGGYLVLTAEFVAWVQVLIYVGAVVVLLLFGIMLTRAPIGRVPRSPEDDPLDSGNRWVALAVAVATAATLTTVLVRGFRDAYITLDAGAGAAEPLGGSIFRTWVLPFEVLSVLLLAALVGAIVLSRTDIGPADEDARSRTGRRGTPTGPPNGRRPAPAAAPSASGRRWPSLRSAAPGQRPSGDARRGGRRLNVRRRKSTEAPAPQGQSHPASIEGTAVSPSEDRPVRREEGGI